MMTPAPPPRETLPLQAAMAPAPHPPEPSQPRQILPPVDLSVEDLTGLDLEFSEPPETPPPLLLRRGGSLLVDSTLLVVLHGCLVYLVSRIISYRFDELVRSAWTPLVLVFLLFHFVYYAYFYRTSRQTPGQVFFKIELRDPFSSRISFGKITIRWLCLIVLGVLNLIPMMVHKPLLLDQLSHTEVRSLK